jgi:hypothetical protein
MATLVDEMRRRGDSQALPDPLGIAALASQQRHMAIHLMDIYGGPEEKTWFVDSWETTGTRLDEVPCGGPARFCRSRTQRRPERSPRQSLGVSATRKVA